MASAVDSSDFFDSEMINALFNCNFPFPSDRVSKWAEISDVDIVPLNDGETALCENCRFDPECDECCGLKCRKDTILNVFAVKEISSTLLWSVLKKVLSVSPDSLSSFSVDGVCFESEEAALDGYWKDTDPNFVCQPDIEFSKTVETDFILKLPEDTACPDKYFRVDSFDRSCVDDEISITLSCIIDVSNDFVSGEDGFANFISPKSVITKITIVFSNINFSVVPRVE